MISDKNDIPKATIHGMLKEKITSDTGKMAFSKNLI